MTRSLAGMLSDMADASDAYEDAVRCRAFGNGFVPMEILTKLTRAEWSRIRMMGQWEARRLVSILDAEPVIEVEIDPSGKDVDHGR